MTIFVPFILGLIWFEFKFIIDIYITIPVHILHAG